MNKVFDDKKKKRPVRWARTNVNIDEHIIIPELNPNVENSDELVEEYISNMRKIPMEMSKPLWEVHILNVETSDATSTAVFRIHHSLGDGVSLISLFLACLRKTTDPQALPSLPPKNKQPTIRSSDNNLLGFLTFLYLSFLLIFKVLWNTLVDAALFVATVLYLKDSTTPLKGVSGVNARFLQRVLSFDDIKLVKNAMGVSLSSLNDNIRQERPFMSRFYNTFVIHNWGINTINDVVLGITQAGVSHYLNEKYGKDKGHNMGSENNLPKHTRLRASLFMNLRPANHIEDLAEKMKGNSKSVWEWGNLIGCVLVPFHIALKDDPLDYIRLAKTTIDRKKQSFEVWITYFTNKVVLKILGLKVAVTLMHKALSNTTLTFSNLAGPSEESAFFGHPVALVSAVDYGLPQGLRIHFQSYMDKMIVALYVNEDVIPDPQLLCDKIEESLALAKNAAIAKTVVKSRHVDKV